MFARRGCIVSQNTGSFCRVVAESLNIMDTQVKVRFSGGGVSVIAHTGPESTRPLPAWGVTLTNESVPCSS